MFEDLIKEKKTEGFVYVLERDKRIGVYYMRGTQWILVASPDEKKLEEQE